MKVTGLEPGKKKKRRLNVYADGEFVFSCFAETASQFGLREGAEIGKEDVEACKAADELIQAREYALRLAAGPPRSEQQFRDKLRARGYSSASQEAALEILRTYSYVDDQAYAEQYAAELFQKYGRWTVRRKLAERGIAADVIDRVTAGIDAGDALMAHLKRLQARPRYEDAHRERDRVIRSLAAKGFDFDEIRSALARQSEEEGDSGA